MQGEVTFITANNVYVRFDNTNGIVIGDTLQLARGLEVAPCLLVTGKSSMSCVCMVITGCKVEMKDRIIFNVPERPEGVLGDQPSDVPVPGDSASVARNGKERIKGRLSAASYSTIASEQDNDHRTMYRFSLNADHIRDSKFSAETYLNYRQLFPSDEHTHPWRTEYLSVYSLAVRFEPDTTLSLTLGRKINNNASSLGAIDGLQAEKYFGNFLAGAIIGFRPDIATYELNFDLLEYGGYVGVQWNTPQLWSRTTLGLLQQNNGGAVDRRYTYFQHSSTINGNLNVFSSFELDLYNQVNGESVSDARLTNLYLSSRYRFSRKVDVFASYDSRKRIVYYETFRNEIEMLLDDDEARQGARLRLNIRPFKGAMLGASYSMRFQSSGQNPSDNINGYLTYSMDPTIGGRWSLQVNRNTSSYLVSDIVSIRHSRSLIRKKLNASIYFRMVQYTFTTGGEGEDIRVKTEQDYYGVDLAYHIGPKLVFSVLGEMSTMHGDQNYRVNACIVKRFDSKK